MSSIYDRQQDMVDVERPSAAIVVGVGGVGSWVALGLALAGVRRIALVDDDVVEESNLNRTPFKESHVGLTKVHAMMELIMERRSECIVWPFECKAEDLPDYTENMLWGFRVYDCRDSITPLKIPKTDRCQITGGYDGTGVTIHINPNYDSIFGSDAVRYRVVPSFVGAPMFLASVIVNYACLPNSRVRDERIMSFDLNDLPNTF